MSPKIQTQNGKPLRLMLMKQKYNKKAITISSATKSVIRNASQAERKTQKYFQYCVKMSMVFAKKCVWQT